MTGKRLFDLVLATLLLLPSMLVCGLLAPIIAWECRASPFFLQTRIGRAGRPYTMLKLRTMRADTPDVPSHQVTTSAITRSGRLLRTLKLDELPQLANILAGTMSFVGPRPCLPTQHELIEARRANGVLDLTPGITGPAQVAGIDMSEPERLAAADRAYPGQWSLRTDLSLLWQTAGGRGRGDAATAGRP